MSSLPENVTELPTEIWRRIFFLLYWTDHSSLKSSALINRRLHEIAASILFRTLQLRVSFAGKQWCLDDLDMIPWKHVKVIVVSGIHWQYGIGDWKKVGLLKVIESATSLQEFQ
ncbi:hypothetical protein N7540_007904 [Penicillium herquei]|nr:hypothetical protein N7540_007904 [Penicillium herquei]